jgi:hypothetical protein
LVGFIVAIFPGGAFGTFSPFTWVATFLAAVLVNALIEFLILWKGFKQNIGKKQFWWLCLANAFSVGVAFGSILLFPIKM